MGNACKKKIETDWKKRKIENSVHIWHDGTLSQQQNKRKRVHATTEVTIPYLRNSRMN